MSTKLLNQQVSYGAQNLHGFEELNFVDLGCGDLV
jgi:hypothetical protein